MDIKVLTVCLLMTGQYVMCQIDVDEIINSCRGRCKPSGLIQCRNGFESTDGECDSSKVCCPKNGNTNNCVCVGKSGECPNGLEEDASQTCQQCCKACQCILLGGEKCPDGTIGGVCSDSNEIYKNCCDDNKCACWNVYIFGETEHTCPTGFTDRGMCNSCCQYTS